MKAIIHCETPEGFNDQALSLISRLIFTLYKQEIHFPPYQCLSLFVYACVLAKSHQSCPTVCSLTDGGWPGSYVHGILQARILKWLPSSPPGDLPNR